MHGRTRLLALATTLVACNAPPREAPNAPVSNAPAPVRLDDIEITDHQSVYVPVHSEVFYRSAEHPYTLAITLTVHNTDPDHGITITEATYFDSDGNALQRYVEQPRLLAPMASASFFVGTSDERGGSGANFIVKWEAETAVYEPVVEATMIGTSGTFGISLLSQGRVYQERQ